MSDVAVIGGGLVGSAVAWGLARAGAKVTVLDEGDDAFRASRGNFGLVWVQGKGDGMHEYASWTRRSAEVWPDLAAALGEEEGVDVGLRQPGGIEACIDDEEYAERALSVKRMHNQPGVGGNDVRMISARASVRMTAMSARYTFCAACTPVWRAAGSTTASITRSSGSPIAVTASCWRPRAAQSMPTRSCWQPGSATAASAPWSASTCRQPRITARSW